MAIWQFVASRAAAVISCVLAFLAALVDGGPAVIGVGVLLLFAAAAIATVEGLAVRTQWYREPGTVDLGWSALVGATVDALLLVALAAFLPSIPAPSAVFPAVAVVKAAAIAWVGLVAWAAIRAKSHPAGRASQVAIVVAGAVVAWLLVDRIVPASWRSEQGLVCAGLGVAAALAVVGCRRLARTRLS